MTTRAHRLKLYPPAADSPGLVESAVRVCGVRRAYWSWATHLARHRPYLQLLERCVPLDGDVIECGVFRGKSLLRIATWLKQQGVRKTVYGLDSFDGFPVDGIGEVELGPGRTPQRAKSCSRCSRFSGHTPKLRSFRASGPSRRTNSP